MSDVMVKLVKTPNPYELGLAVTVRDVLLGNHPELFPSSQRKYSDFITSTDDLVTLDQSFADGYGGYTYVDCATGSQGGEGIDQFPTTVLYFAKHKTEADKASPFRTTFSFGDHRWPPILKALEFFKDTAFSRSTNGVKYGSAAIIAGPSYYVRQLYQCEVNEGSRFRLEEFFSDSPFTIPSYPVPVPRAIFFQIPGASGSFPECIGPAINIPTTQSASAAFITGGPVSASGLVNGQRYPATQFKRWQPYILTDQQEFQNGWYRRRIMVIPPFLRRKINIR